MEMPSVAVGVLARTLGVLSRLAIEKYRPGIVGITGSVGKTSAKLAIAAVLGSERRVRAARGNLNNELGLPLAVLGDWSDGELDLVSRKQPPGTRRAEKLFFWIKVIVRGVSQVFFFREKEFPEVLVLEYGADRPGDLKRLLGVASPNIGVVTAVGEVPAHVEFYENPDEVAREKSRLIEHLPAQGFAILNRDDEVVMNMKDRTRAHCITFGFERGAEMRILRFGSYAEGGAPGGISFQLEYGGSVIPVKLRGMLGRSHAYAAAAAASAGVAFGMNLRKIAEALPGYVPPPHRMEIVRGVKDTWIIDDAYNASPLSMESALESLEDLPARRRIAVLGDMLELGPYAMETHEEIGRLAGKIADVLVTVGPRGKLVAEGARKARMNRKNILSFDLAEEAAKPVENLLKKGDLVLVKASRAIGLEKVVEEIRGLI
ncbi:hypothetical protein C4587_00120 [Candidatus Parcubacteria bacterium]|nr:MAG: hypothetical protein C4587_00120 [Candidatus Parcubacteria bacterium]